MPATVDADTANRIEAPTASPPLAATIAGGTIIDRSITLASRGRFQPSSVNGAAVDLPLKEFELLEVLLRNAGRVLTRGLLIDRVWGADYVGDTKTLDVHVKRLRGKIEPNPAEPKYLLTIRGVGFKFEA